MTKPRGDALGLRRERSRHCGAAVAVRMDVLGVARQGNFAVTAHVAVLSYSMRVQADAVEAGIVVVGVQLRRDLDQLVLYRLQLRASRFGYPLGYNRRSRRQGAHGAISTVARHHDGSWHLASEPWHAQDERNFRLAQFARRLCVADAAAAQAWSFGGEAANIAAVDVPKRQPQGCQAALRRHRAAAAAARHAAGAAALCALATAVKCQSHISRPPSAQPPELEIFAHHTCHGAAGAPSCKYADPNLRHRCCPITFTSERPAWIEPMST
mmetsp:Transcript_107328/g.308866  ORF Transcript_107328/g.308866 Transcript_107328/m.308866 type:complete len:269 (+) Transcript_107328:1733-2539(+)